MSRQTVLLTRDTWETETEIAAALARAYATSFWGAAWKELLAVRDPDGGVLRQYGTFDEDGNVFPETAALLRDLGLSADGPDWPLAVWERAAAGLLRVASGERVEPYWSLDRARDELRTFVSPVADGGFGGEILVLAEREEIVGFTAYACARGDEGRAVADKRFPTARLHVPIDDPSPRALSVRGLLEERCPGDVAFGIFLDHAVSEAQRGNGLGSRLFDERLGRLLELGADVIFGRTMVTAPRQYAGNYLARGLRPIAADGTDAFSRAKHYFAASRAELRPRAGK